MVDRETCRTTTLDSQQTRSLEARQPRGPPPSRPTCRCPLATVDLVEPWDRSAPGVLCLPSGRLVRGRGLRHGLPAGQLPQFGLYLQGKPPPPVAWDSRWLRWPDWWLPADPVQARHALADLWQRAAHERVEVACSGGQGRTGTVLACLAILDGVPHDQAVGYVREHYNSRAVETPWQRRFVTRYQP